MVQVYVLFAGSSRYVGTYDDYAHVKRIYMDSFDTANPNIISKAPGVTEVEFFAKNEVLKKLMDKYEHALIRLEEEKGPGNVTESDIHMLAKSFPLAFDSNLPMLSEALIEGLYPHEYRLRVICSSELFSAVENHQSKRAA